MFYVKCATQEILNFSVDKTYVINNFEKTKFFIKNFLTKLKIIEI